MMAGIGNPKRAALLRLPHLDTRAVEIWQRFLRKERRERYSTGLLITVLESGDPPPPARPNGHLLDCECSDCNIYNYACFYCHNVPCTCQDNDDEQVEDDWEPEEEAEQEQPTGPQAPPTGQPGDSDLTPAGAPETCSPEPLADERPQEQPPDSKPVP